MKPRAPILPNYAMRPRGSGTRQYAYLMRINHWHRIAAVLTGTALLFFASFVGVSHSENSGTSTDDLADKAVEVPEFSIAVKLSPEAEKRLHSLNESILVIAYFDGDPLPGQGKDNAPFRDVFLGQDEKLVDTTDVARFDSTKLSMSSWNRLADRNYFVTINVVSARKRSKNNLLDCGVPIDRISNFAGKATEVQCRLIGEPAAPTK